MIALDNLDFGYTEEAPIIQGLTAKFSRGTCTALVGRSGSGKSTLLYIVGLMLSPIAGTLTVDGVPVEGLADWERSELRASLMGFIFQDALLDPARSVLDNVCEGALYNGVSPAEARGDALDLLARFDVDVDPHRRPGQISGGQAQRVALCRALVNRPRIVLADEPTGNLDDDTSDIVWQALTETAEQGATVIIATHDRGRAKMCDSVLEVGHGSQR